MSKRMAALEKAKVYDNVKLYSIPEASSVIKKTATAKFDETIELHVKLGVDPKQSDQNVRGTVVLPHGTGATKRVVVVAKGEKVKEASAAGADLVETGVDPQRLRIDELDRLAALCEAHDLTAVTDEIYEHIVYDGVRHVPLATRGDMRARTVSSTPCTSATRRS